MKIVLDLIVLVLVILIKIGDAVLFFGAFLVNLAAFLPKTLTRLLTSLPKPFFRLPRFTLPSVFLPKLSLPRFPRFSFRFPRKTAPATRYVRPIVKHHRLAT